MNKNTQEENRMSTTPKQCACGNRLWKEHLCVNNTCLLCCATITSTTGAICRLHKPIKAVERPTAVAPRNHRRVEQLIGRIRRVQKEDDKFSEWNGYEVTVYTPSIVSVSTTKTHHNF
jgi:hypothetical protein